MCEKTALFNEAGKLFRLACRPYIAIQTLEVALRVFISLMLFWASLLSTACQANAVDAGAPLESTASLMSEPISPNSGEPQMTPSLPADAGLQALINKAIADLAQRLSSPTAEIKVLEATAVVWPDSSLGCPQPGMAYTQVPEDGLLIRLQAGEQIYEYHSGGIRDPFLCIKTGKDPNPPPQIDIFNLTPSQPKSPPDGSITPDNSIPPGENQ
jgi:hypothetical protein